MILGRYRQRPRDIRRRQVDYRDFLETSESLSTVTPTVSPTTDTPLVVNGIVIDVNGKKFAYVVQGGEHGVSYSVSLELTTTAGQRKNDTIEFDIEDDE